MSRAGGPAPQPFSAGRVAGSSPVQLERRAGRSLRALRELDAELPILAPHDAAAPPEDQRELVGHLLALADGEPRTARRDVADDAGDKGLVMSRVDVREILHVVTRTRTLIAKAGSQQCHGTLVKIRIPPR